MSEKPVRFGFVTCVQLGLECLETIYDVGGEVVAIFTIPDNFSRKKSGRVYVDDFAAAHGVPVYKHKHINDPESLESIRVADLDWLFIIGWSQIASGEVLASVRKGCIGMHPTLLPMGRGRAAIPWAIIKGLDKTGVSMFVLDEGVDSGPLLGQYEIPLPPDANSTWLYEEVCRAHRDLMGRVFPELSQEEEKIIVQDDALATYWEGRTPANGLLKSEMTTMEADRLIRATTRPYPGAFVVDGDTLYRVWSAARSSALARAGQVLVDGDVLSIGFTDGSLESTEWETEAAPVEAV